MTQVATKQDTDKIIDYIKSKTELDKDKWIKIKTKDAAMIINRSPTTASVVLNAAIKDERISYKEDLSGNGGPNAKSKLFRYDEVVKKTPEVKDAMHNTYKNLTQKEVINAETVLFEQGVCSQPRLQKLIEILNAYKSEAISKELSISSQVSDLILERESVVIDALIVLSSARLIEFNPRKELRPLENKTLRQEFEEVKEVETEIENKDIDVSVSTVVESTNSVVADNTELINALSNFGSLQNEFISYFKKLTSDITPSHNSDEFDMILEVNNKLTLDLSSANDVIEKLLKENSVLKDTNSLNEKRVEDSLKHVKACREKIDAVIVNMQSELNVLLAEISNSISNYTQVSTWDRTPQRNAQFQSTIIKAVTQTVDNVLSYNKTNTTCY